MFVFLACEDEDLQSSRFLAYTSLKIPSNNIQEGCTQNVSLTECLQVCAQHENARTCDHQFSVKHNYMQCCPQYVTVLDVPWKRVNASESTHYQKTCL